MNPNPLRNYVIELVAGLLSVKDTTCQCMCSGV